MTVPSTWELRTIYHEPNERAALKLLDLALLMKSMQ